MTVSGPLGASPLQPYTLPRAKSTTSDLQIKALTDTVIELGKQVQGAAGTMTELSRRMVQLQRSQSQLIKGCAGVGLLFTGVAAGILYLVHSQTQVMLGLRATQQQTQKTNDERFAQMNRTLLALSTKVDNSTQLPSPQPTPDCSVYATALSDWQRASNQTLSQSQEDCREDLRICDQDVDNCIALNKEYNTTLQDLGTQLITCLDAQKKSSP